MDLCVLGLLLHMNRAKTKFGGGNVSFPAVICCLFLYKLKKLCSLFHFVVDTCTSY